MANEKQGDKPQATAITPQYVAAVTCVHGHKTEMDPDSPKRPKRVVVKPGQPVDATDEDIMSLIDAGAIMSPDDYAAKIRVDELLAERQRVAAAAAAL